MFVMANIRLKSKPEIKNRVLALRCSDKEFNKVKMLAMLYSEGNMSEYTLYAALNFRPSRGDLIQEPPPKKRKPL